MGCFKLYRKRERERKRKGEQFICFFILSSVFKVSIYIQLTRDLISPRGSCCHHYSVCTNQGFQQRNRTCPHVQYSNFIKLFFFVYSGLLDPLLSCYYFYLIMFSRVKKHLFLFLLLFFFFLFFFTSRQLSGFQKIRPYGM